MMNKRRMKPVLVVLSLILILGCTVGGSLAYLAAKTGTAENAFEGGKVSCSVKEGNVVENTGTVPAFIRVKVVANLVNDKGHYFEKSPAVAVTGTDWVTAGGYCYYSKEVPADGVTPALTVTCDEVTGYKLQYYILAEAIQSEPKTAVTSVWGYTPAG